MDSRFLRPLFVVSVLGALAGACSSGSGSTGSGATRDSFIAGYCDLLAPCCAKAGLRADGVQCRSFAGGLAPAGYDAVAGEQCLTEMRAASASPDFCDDLGQSKSPSCDSVFPGGSSGGTKAPGETCTDDDECAPSKDGKVDCARAHTSGGGEVRKCQVIVKGTAGSTPCAATKEGNVTYYSSFDDDVPAKAYLCDTADGLRCDSTTHACTKIPAVGEPCGSGFASCVEGAYCTGGTCAARKAAGEACAFDSECVETAYCDSSTKVCTAKLADGVACTSSSRCASGSCVNGKCEKDSGGDLGLALLCGK